MGIHLMMKGSIVATSVIFLIASSVYSKDTSDDSFQIKDISSRDRFQSVHTSQCPALWSVLLQCGDKCKDVIGKDSMSCTQCAANLTPSFCKINCIFCIIPVFFSFFQCGGPATTPEEACKVMDCVFSKTVSICKDCICSNIEIFLSLISPSSLELRVCLGQIECRKVPSNPMATWQQQTQ